MSVFNSVLVGVDLWQPGGIDARHFSPPVEEAIKNGLWLAEKARASLTFFAAIDMFEEELRALETDWAPELTPRLRALDRVVESARERGLSVTTKFVRGQAWVELIREVERARHDVVIIGTRNAGVLRRLLFGSTAMRLLHNCPCPVWVTRPEERPLPHNILVTSDFSPVSDITVKLGLALGELSGAKVNLLHAVDFEVDRKWSVGLLYFNTEQYHAQVKAEAYEKLAGQLARIAGQHPLSAVELHIVVGESVADTAILEFIQRQHIDLLLMGTIARGGLARASMGNTAERLVTHVPCSMLAVKPADFKSTIHAIGASGS